METLKKYALSLPSRIASKTVTRFVLSLIFVAGLVACGNKDGGTAAVPTVPVGLQGCQNCSTIPSPILMTTFDAESLYMNNWPVRMVNMQVYAEASRYQAGSTSSYNLYQGPVSVQGTLEVQQTLYSNNNACVIPPGNYVLQTYSVGSINQGRDLQVPDMVAGAIRLRMVGASYVGGSMLVNESGAIRWKGTLEIVSFNNINCGGGLWSYMK